MFWKIIIGLTSLFAICHAATAYNSNAHVFGDVHGFRRPERIPHLYQPEYIFSTPDNNELTSFGQTTYYFPNSVKQPVFVDIPSYSDHRDVLTESILLENIQIGPKPKPKPYSPTAQSSNVAEIFTYSPPSSLPYEFFEILPQQTYSQTPEVITYPSAVPQDFVQYVPQTYTQYPQTYTQGVSQTFNQNIPQSYSPFYAQSSPQPSNSYFTHPTTIPNVDQNFGFSYYETPPQTFQHYQAAPNTRPHYPDSQSNIQQVGFNNVNVQSSMSQLNDQDPVGSRIIPISKVVGNAGHSSSRRQMYPDEPPNSKDNRRPRRYLEGVPEQLPPGANKHNGYGRLALGNSFNMPIIQDFAPQLENPMFMIPLENPDESNSNVNY